MCACKKASIRTTIRGYASTLESCDYKAIVICIYSTLFILYIHRRHEWKPFLNSWWYGTMMNSIGEYFLSDGFSSFYFDVSYVDSFRGNFVRCAKAIYVNMWFIWWICVCWMALRWFLWVTFSKWSRLHRTLLFSFRLKKLKDENEYIGGLNCKSYLKHMKYPEKKIF